MARLCVNINEMCNFLDRNKLVYDLQRFGIDGITEKTNKQQVVDNQQPANCLQLITESPLSEDLLFEVIDNHIDTIVITDIFDTRYFKDVIKNIVSRLKESGIKVSALIEANPKMPNVISELGFNAVTLDCSAYSVEGERVILNYQETAEAAKKMNLSVNASHGLNMKNLRYLIDNVPYIDFITVGHEFVADALIFGIENTVQLYRRCLMY